MKYRLKGLDTLLTQLADMSNPLVFDEEVRKALDKGSDVVADITRSELNGLPTDDRYGRQEYRTGLRTIQKKELIASFGITPIQEKKDKVNRKTGVRRGLNSFNQPYVRVARMLENGTSYMRKNPVFTKASRKARKECIRVMAESLTKSINNIWNR